MKWKEVILLCVILIIVALGTIFAYNYFNELTKQKSISDQSQRLNYEKENKIDEFTIKHNSLIQMVDELNDGVLDWNIMINQIDDGSKLDKAIFLYNSYLEDCMKANSKLNSFYSWLNSDWNFWLSILNEEQLDYLDNVLRGKIDSCNKNMESMGDTVVYMKKNQLEQREQEFELQLITGLIKNFAFI
jgi:hypothetical protein